MKTRAFQKLLSQIEKLTPKQTKELQNQLNKQNSLKVIKSISVEIDHCPHCGATNLYKWGVRSKLQRYKCKECNKTFNALTKTPLARLRHKEKWNDYAKELLNSTSIETSAKNCQVAVTTSFRWRHRMLQTPVLIARDRNGNMTDAVLSNSQDGTIAQVMLPLLDRRDVLLCSDSKSSYKSFARMFDFVHETINASKEYVNGAYHVQNVNAYGSRLKNWMVRFHGVATKYLDNYLGWMRILDTQKGITPDELLGVVINYRNKDYGLPPLTLI